MGVGGSVHGDANLELCAVSFVSAMASSRAVTWLRSTALDGLAPAARSLSLLMKDSGRFWGSWTLMILHTGGQQHRGTAETRDTDTKVLPRPVDDPWPMWASK